MGDLNGYHQEWLGSMTMNHHGVQPLTRNWAGCNQLVVGLLLVCGGTLDLLITAVPDLAWVVIVAPTGNSDHSSLSMVILMAQAFPNLCVSRKDFLKHKVNWNIKRLPIGMS